MHCSSRAYKISQISSKTKKMFDNLSFNGIRWAFNHLIWQWGIPKWYQEHGIGTKKPHWTAISCMCYMGSSLPNTFRRQAAALSPFVFRIENNVITDLGSYLRPPHKNEKNGNISWTTFIMNILRTEWQLLDIHIRWKINFVWDWSVSLCLSNTCMRHWIFHTVQITLL